MNNQQLQRYARHLLLPEFSQEKQQNLLNSTVLLVGAGGLGCVAALYLAASGVGRLIVLDDDEVDLTNLQRQIAHAESSIGQAKVSSLARSVLALNSSVKVEAIQQRFSADNIQLISQADAVLDCSDNFVTRQLINQICVQQNKPLISAAAISFAGQLGVYYGWRPTSPCYACIFPADQPPPQTSCATFGVLSPLVGVMGSMQALECIKVLTETGLVAQGQLILYDALQAHWHTIKVQKNKFCLVCRADN